MRDAALILHFIGLAMGLGTSFAFMFLGLAASKLDPSERGKFMINALSIARMGHIGLTLLFLSGLYLIMPYHKEIMNMPLFLVKLILFIALGAFVGILSSKGKKAASGDVSQFPKIAVLGRLSLITGIAIVVLAVLSFH